MPIADPNTLLRQAQALHAQGRFDDAIAIYQRLLQQFPDYPPLCNMLGTAYLQAGKTADGVALLDKSLRLQPDQPAVLSNRGCGLLTLGRPEQALGDFERAIARDPNNAVNHSNRGNALTAMGRRDEALAAYGRAIALQPNHAEARFNRGTLLIDIGRLAEALADFDRTAALCPDNPAIHSNRAMVLMELGRAAEALAAADRALALRSDYVAALVNRGNALAALDRNEEAVASYERALAFDPDNGAAYYGRGNARLAMKAPDLALADYETAIAKGLDSVDALVNRTTAMIDQGRTDEALAELDRILERFPDDAAAHFNRACILFEDKRLDEARVEIERTLALKPGQPEAIAKRGMLALLTGDFESGWIDYEARWDNRHFRSQRRSFRQPQWTGEPLVGKTLLIHIEQGFGDAVQFARYAPLAAAAGARVLLAPPTALSPLLETLRDVDVIQAGAPLPDFDFHCPVLSLPGAFRTTLATIPATVPYLAADPTKVAAWREKLGNKTRPRIGLMWSGRGGAPALAKRSLSPELLAPLTALDCEFHSLQKDVPAPAGVIAHPAEEMDFSGTAALIETLDLTISIDTSVAHIAGALGKPLWLLLPWAAEWRWLIGRGDSPWYPTATLFRQPGKGDWGGVIAAVVERLQNNAN